MSSESAEEPKERCENNSIKGCHISVVVYAGGGGMLVDVSLVLVREDLGIFLFFLFFFFKRDKEF